jgi:curved DNA-binding protein CbpA
MSVPDPYKVLQVDPAADRASIEAAYRRLARRYHPDVSVEPDAIARMVQINQAWEVLRDPVRRASVDRARTRTAGTSARTVAADGRDHAATHRTPPGPPPGSAHAPGEVPTWPIPGMQDPSAGSFGARGEPSSSGWTGGRSTASERDGQRTPNPGAAGPPPGNPSGSIISFGRYQGWTLGEIARTDLEFLEWLDRVPIGRMYRSEIDALLRKHGRRVTETPAEGRGKGIFRRR